MTFNDLCDKDLLIMDNKQEANLIKNQNYVNLYNIYRKLFTEYIINKVNLKKYDDLLCSSELNFQITKSDEIDSYQYFSFNNLKYFYVRNNIYIENLTDEEKEFFNEKINNNDYELDDKTIEIIEKTIEKVIIKDFDKNKKYEVFYGPMTSSFKTLSTNIVIGFRYDEFYDDGLTDNEWNELHLKQMQYLIDLFENLKKEMENLVIFNYSEFSCIPRKIYMDK